jgi:hypothetical protein
VDEKKIIKNREETEMTTIFSKCIICGHFFDSKKVLRDHKRQGKEQTTPQPYRPENAGPPPGNRIKRYTSDGKPVYE